MIIRDLIAEASTCLMNAGVEAGRRDAWLLLGHATGRDHAGLIAHAADEVGHDHEAVFRGFIERRIRREPVAQIVGVKEFWSLPFAVNAHVLCPRPESETLVDMAITLVKQRVAADNATLRFLDLGTGSGCLLLALLHELPAAHGIGVDLSEKALAVARSNGRALRLSSRAHWVRGDWGAAIDGVFDLIVSNPPYIELGDLPQLAPEIRLFEPHKALLAGRDGLDAYRSLAPDLYRLLTPRGLACLELGFGQADAVASLMAEASLVCLSRQRDLAGIDRCLVLKRRP